MFNLKNKQSGIEMLQKKYEILMSQWQTLSPVNWSKTGIKYTEAERVIQEIEQIQLGG